LLLLLLTRHLLSAGVFMKQQNRRKAAVEARATHMLKALGTNAASWGQIAAACTPSADSPPAAAAAAAAAAGPCSAGTGLVRFMKYAAGATIACGPLKIGSRLLLPLLLLLLVCAAAAAAV
jgi:hypothetical protein